MKKYTYIIILVSGLCFTLSAQPNNPDAPTPFGFVEILIGAGALLGGKKAYDANKNKPA